MNDPSLPATLARPSALAAGLFVLGGCGLDVLGLGGAASSGFIPRDTGGLASRGGSGNPPTDRASDWRG
jgi:hypothetical protein